MDPEKRIKLGEVYHHKWMEMTQLQMKEAIAENEKALKEKHDLELEKMRHFEEYKLQIKKEKQGNNSGKHKKTNKLISGSSPKSAKLLNQKKFRSKKRSSSPDSLKVSKKPASTKDAYSKRTSINPSCFSAAVGKKVIHIQKGSEIKKSP